MSRQYTSLAEYYDKLNAHVDYAAWADFLTRTLRSNNVPDGSLVLDLACGTGNITLPMANAGYDMIGADISPEMLNEARKKAAQKGLDILWLCQDMRSFELYGTVAAVLCCLDSINYLTGRTGLKRCFSLAHNYLDPDGMFIFDVNTPYKFKNVYSDRQYILEAEDVYCGWKNYFDEKSGLCEFNLSLFIKNGEEYYRADETQTERCWSIKTLKSYLAEAGFEIINVVSDFLMNPPQENSERLFFICRAMK